jgi:hypothetical protein
VEKTRSALLFFMCCCIWLNKCDILGFCVLLDVGVFWVEGEEVEVERGEVEVEGGEVEAEGTEAVVGTSELETTHVPGDGEVT